MKDVLLINDMPGVGKVALSAMIPILSTMKVKLSYLPTAMVSNNFGYGVAEICDLSDYMKKTEKVWRGHDFQFDIITTGFLMSEDQVDTIEKIIEYQKNKPVIITDPIMGDDGKIYPGLSEDLIKVMRKMMPLSDIIVPNLTEAMLILGEECPENMCDDTIKDWIHKLKDMGAKSIVITSVEIDEKHYVYVYSNKDDEIYRVEYDFIPVHFGGTGDIFAALLTGRIAEEDSLEDSVKFAVKVLSSIIEEEAKNKQTAVCEIPVENYLNTIKNFK